jgi:heptaprenylglyceryl phosphate synthase
MGANRIRRISSLRLTLAAALNGGGIANATATVTVAASTANATVTTSLTKKALKASKVKTKAPMAPT